MGSSRQGTYQHPLVLSPQLKRARLHHSGVDVIQIDQLKTEFPFAASNVKDARPAAQQLPPKGVNQEPGCKLQRCLIKTSLLV